MSGYIKKLEIALKVAILICLINAYSLPFQSYESNADEGIAAQVVNEELPKKIVAADISVLTYLDVQKENNYAGAKADPAVEYIEEGDDMVQNNDCSGKNNEAPTVLLTQIVDQMDLSYNDFDFSQLILVTSDGSEATIYCYESDGSGLWSIVKDFGCIKGYVGRNSVITYKQEGDGCTPAGLYKLGYAFGNSEKPDTSIYFKEITENSYWVDDTSSIYYNRWVEAGAIHDWSSAEHLSEYKNSYAYAVVIEYNTVNTISGAGSAIFLHCGSKPTSGCIAVSEEDMLYILSWLSPDKTPHILIAA